MFSGGLGRDQWHQLAKAAMKYDTFNDESDIMVILHFAFIALVIKL